MRDERRIPSRIVGFFLILVTYPLTFQPIFLAARLATKIIIKKATRESLPYLLQLNPASPCITIIPLITKSSTPVSLACSAPFVLLHTPNQRVCRFYHSRPVHA